jgi:hypothetical protein
MFIHQLKTLRRHIHINYKQLIKIMKINIVDELIVSEITHFRTEHIYKQITGNILIN